MSEAEELIQRLGDLLTVAKVRQLKLEKGYTVEIAFDTQHESMRCFNVITDIIERA